VPTADLNHAGWERGNTTLHYNLGLVDQHLERIERARHQFEAVLHRGVPKGSRRAGAARLAMSSFRIRGVRQRACSPAARAWLQ
jgi:hypothetical protein